MELYLNDLPEGSDDATVVIAFTITRDELRAGFDDTLSELADAVAARVLEIDTADGGVVVPQVLTVS